MDVMLDDVLIAEEEAGSGMKGVRAIQRIRSLMGWGVVEEEKPGVALYALL